MSTPNKPRSDSALKTLPEERQAEIYSRLTVKRPDWKDISYQAVKKWLADDGFTTSLRALSEFYSWYALQEALRGNQTTVESLLADLKSEKPDMTPEQLDVAGQMFFTALSIQQQDSLGWKRAQDVKKNLRLVSALERRLALIEAKAEQANQAKGIMGDKALTEEQKRQRMLQLFGM